MPHSQAWFNRYEQAWNDHDVHAIVAFFADGAQYSSALNGFCYTAPDELRQSIDMLFQVVPDFHMHVHFATASDAGIVIEWTTTSTPRQAGFGVDESMGKVVHNGVSVGELNADGMITRLRDYSVPETPDD